ncbi:MAG: hypothetical protein IPK14_01530 [Blastocatellia bacterium]|nr:hypothetical protein [Blastocatellia bacterium]MBL8196549.1 hypothetical protein [Blastocatellia bacterium]MBN8721577.1 hypothetical protein [Acidobacteriota bacterium]
MQQVKVGQTWQSLSNQNEIVIKDLQNKIVVAEVTKTKGLVFDTVFNLVNSYKLIKESISTSKTN